LRALYLILSASAHLLFVAEVTRHGARAPSKLFHFNEKFWKEDQLKQLTEIGLRQHFDLGRKLRMIYPTIFDKYDPKVIDILTSPSPRAVFSAYAHLAGLYPDGPSWLQKYDGSGDPDKVHIDLPDFPSDTPIKIAEGRELHAVKGHKEFICPRIKQIKKEMESSEEYKAQEAFWNTTFFPNISETLGLPVTSISDVNSIASAIQCEAATGRDPVKLPNDMLKKAYEIRTFKINHVPYYSKEAQTLSSSGFFERLTNQIEGVIQGSGLKYAYYSAHDYTLLSFVNSLSSLSKVMPGFADSLVFELYDDQTVRVLYNQQPLLMEHCPGTCNWSELKEVFAKHKVDDLAKACELV